MSSKQEILWKEHRTAQEKYLYFLLAAAASAIALAVQRTSGMTLSASMIPLGLAVGAWSVSFFAGCRYANSISAVTFANLSLLQVEAGEHPKLHGHPSEMVEAAASGIRDAIELHEKKISFWAQLQFRALICGAVSFLVWHVAEMAIRMP